MPQYAQLLSKETGATFGRSVRRDAEATLCLPYYTIPGEAELASRPNGSVLAAYFTHREPPSQLHHKAQAWTRAAAAVDLRLAMSVRYAAELETTGPTCLLPLPVLESQIGTLTPRRYRIGLSQRRYGDGRKARA